MRLRPLDEIRNDKEVAGEAHPLDDADLVVEPLLIDGEIRRGLHDLQPLLEARLGLRAQFLRLVAAGLAVEGGQDGLVLPGPEGATPGDLDRRGQRFGQVGECRRHLLRRAEILLGRGPRTLGLADIGGVGDTQQHIMHRMLRGPGEARITGGRQRQPQLVRKVDQHGLRRRLFGTAMALQLDIEPVAEGGMKVLQPFAGLGNLPGRGATVEQAFGPARETDQPFGMFEQGRKRHLIVVSGGRQKGGRGKLHEVAIAGLVLGKQRDMPALALYARLQHGKCKPGDRLDALFAQHLGKLQRCEEVGIGHANGRSARISRPFRQILRPDHAL